MSSEVEKELTIPETIDVSKRDSLKKAAIGAAAIGVGLVGLSSVANASGVILRSNSTTSEGTLNLRAGTTAAGTAPLKFTSGTVMDTPEVGAVEFQTDKLYATITTGAARKEIALVDSALSSTTIPVGTAEGRLANSGLTFSSGTLTVAGGSGQSSISCGLVVNSLPSTSSTVGAFQVKGTTTSINLIATDPSADKIGFFNATPVVKPTTSGAAATFVAGSGTAVNDASTFDGYTIKQVVKALRNLGLLT
ncbi:MAG: hypothetical protein WC746_05395 [archaeon]|jgi:hypothetical protein